MTETITVADVLGRARGYLAGRGVDSPRLDAELLLADVLGCDRLALYTGFDRPLTTAELDAYRAFVARRGRREPVAYILGVRGFRNLVLHVGPAVLVPRPETEMLVEWGVEVAPPGAAVLDWGTGSGAIALAVTHERPDVVATGIDRSGDALAVARDNDPDGRVEWLHSDGFAALSGRRFDLILANPPYIAEEELTRLAPELAFEPREALVAGRGGLECYEALAREAPAHLAPDARLIVEVGEGQAGEVQELLRSAGFTELAVRADLAGIPRVVGGRV